MRCIETAICNPDIFNNASIKSNMRCIETVMIFPSFIPPVLIKSNMRCIEICRKGTEGTGWSFDKE